MNSDVKFKYTIVGGSNSDELLYQTTDLNLNEHVSLVPRMSHENVLKEIFNSDIFLLPSVEEGIANVVYESMILRTIVVCTDYQGMKEIIKEDETGFLFKNRSPHDIYNSLIKVINLKKDFLSQVSNNAKKIIEQNHKKSEYGKKFNSLYKKVYEN